MNVLAEYRVLTIPRFALDERDFRDYDAWLAQRALWSVLIFQMVRKHRTTVELRYGCLDDAEPSFVSLRLHGTGSDALTEDLRQIDALLPSEYRWERDTSGRPDLTRPARIARVVRRVEFMDLPAASLNVLRSGTWAPELGKGASAPAAGGRPQAAFGGGNVPLGFRLTEGDSLREVPLAETTFGEIQSRQFCLPVPGPISNIRPRLKTLLQAIQGAGFAVVSVCLHPIAAEDRRRAQGIALNFQHFLNPFVDSITSSGFADENTVHTAFNRFALPDGYLFYVSVRVAAAASEAAVGIANLVAESIGGARAFQVIPPTREASSAVLHDAYLDIPGPGWSAARRDAMRKQLGEDMAARGIAPISDTEVVDFLLRLPHVFALEEANVVLRLPTSDDEGLPGLETQPVAPFSIPSLRFLPVEQAGGGFQVPPPGRVRIGMVQRSGFGGSAASGGRFSTFAWHTLDPLDLTKHALIVGSTGSGKTMTTLFLVRELARIKVPVMVIEPVKTEYYTKLRGLVPGLIRCRLEGDIQGKPATGYLAFDPLRVPAGITVARHCSYLKSCFEASFALTEFLALLLENGLRAYYEASPADGGCGLGKFTRGGPGIGAIRDSKVYPSFATFRTFLTENYLKKELASMMQSRGSGDAVMLIDAFRRRFVNLGDGLLGEMFKLADAHYIAQKGAPRAYDIFGLYLQKNIVIELDAVADADQKALIMAFMMSRLFEYRQAEDFEARENNRELPTRLRHFLIVEEAHRLLSTGAAASGRSSETVGAGAKAKAVQLFVDMLAEVRAFGQGLAIVEQIPTKIVPEAVKNTNLKIMLRLTAKDDREYLGEAMNFTESQKRFVTNLKVERGRQINFVVFEEGVEQPLLLALPLPASGADGHADPYAECFPNKE